MKKNLKRPVRPDGLESSTAPSFDLGALAAELLAEPASERSGRGAVTLVSHPGLTLVLTALRAGGEISEHRAPGPIAITGILGQVTVDAAGSGEALSPGCTIAFPPGALHSVRAERDSAFLLAIGSAD